MAISRRRRLLSILTVFLGVALLTTGCAKEEPKPTPTPTKTTIFASEEAALQAAVDVFQQFNSLFDKVRQGDADAVEQMRPILTEEMFETVSSDLTDLASEERTEGASSFYGEELLEFNQSATSATITMGVCRDLSGVTVYDPAGENVTEDARPGGDVVPVKLVFSQNDAESLLIEELVQWQEASTC